MLIGLLFFFGKTKIPASSIGQMANSTAGSISFEEYELQKADKLAATDKKNWEGLHTIYKETKQSDTANYRKICADLSIFWKSLQNSSLYAYYNYQRQISVNTANSWLDAGDVLLSVYKNNPDSLISNNLLTFALRSLENASAKDPKNISLKIQIAEIYVQTAEPMKGITMLRTLGDSLPDNMDVQMSLARLSIQSGQLDKAKERLQKILQHQPQNTEALYFMAITEAQMGHTDEAVRLLELCKTLVNNDEFSNEINNLIQEIKNKKV